jgi:hypothetical protein
MIAAMRFRLGAHSQRRPAPRYGSGSGIYARTTPFDTLATAAFNLGIALEDLGRRSEAGDRFSAVRHLKSYKQLTDPVRS